MAAKYMTQLGEKRGLTLSQDDLNASSMLRAYFWAILAQVQFLEAESEWPPFFQATKSAFVYEIEVIAKTALTEWIQSASDELVVLAYMSTQHDEEVDEDWFFDQSGILSGFVGEKRTERIYNLYHEIKATIRIDF